MQVFVLVKNVIFFFFSQKKKLVNMINNNVTLVVNKLFIYSRNFLHNITLCFFFLCLKLFLFFCF